MKPTSGWSELAIAAKVLAILPSAIMALFALLAGLVSAVSFFEEPRHGMPGDLHRQFTGVAALLFLCSAVGPLLLIWLIVSGPRYFLAAWYRLLAVAVVGTTALVSASYLLMGASSALIWGLLGPSVAIGAFELCRLLWEALRAFGKRPST